MSSAATICPSLFCTTQQHKHPPLFICFGGLPSQKVDRFDFWSGTEDDFLKPMTIVVAPDSFKESLSADEAAKAIAAGFREVFPEAKILRIPVADGGEGTVAAILSAVGGREVPVSVMGPMGVAVAAFFGISSDGRTAFLEMAAASGLELVAVSDRNPLKATSYGTGELIRAALDAGVERLVIGIGGSATVDGGAGALQALGASFLDAEDVMIDARGNAPLSRVARIDLSRVDGRLRRCSLEIACDVDNPLLGPAGAAAVFGPQKGAAPEMVPELEANLAVFSRALAEASGTDISAMPGAGAAGGIGGALVACFGAKLCPGLPLLAELVGLEEAIQEADLVITGEGRIDAQTARGKTPAGVAEIAKRYGKPVIALAGCLGEGVEEVYRCGIDAVFSIQQGPCTVQEAYANASINLQKTARNLAGLLKLSNGLLQI